MRKLCAFCGVGCQAQSGGTEGIQSARPSRRGVGHVTSAPNKAPAPNRRLRFPLGSLGDFEYPPCAPPASPAAVGEARRWARQHQ